MQPPLAVPIPHVHPQGHVPLSMPVSVASGSGPVLVPIRPGAPWSMPTTPSRRDGANAAAAGASPGSSAATATPLDSLVSAARSMMNGAAPEEAGDVAGDGRRRSLRTSTRSGRKGGQGTDRDASPVPKKRKVGANTGAVSPTRNASEAGMSKKRGQRRTATRAQEKTAPDRKGKGRSVEEQEEPEQPLVSSTSITQRGTAPIGSTRVPSALDVLAEQAAQEIRPPVGAATHERRHSTSPARTERSNSQTTELDAVAELGHPASQSFLQAAGPSAQTLYTTLPNSIASTRAQSERLDAAATSNKRSIHSAPPLSIEVIPVSKKPSELGSSERQRTMG
ncbi:hypothetical protein CERSUDRAFT_110886 [Gelatoporia subvermispora B]|uniref:Uncharacterized protein n=1 Tax=Ceriporiopsis subvermispora (strain B) TaxID=914234 RepID=M2R769_CERS8|nr:hypothetical protein CERSUDRAFT_110886 [Gelatoporia subvermispora B]